MCQNTFAMEATFRGTISLEFLLSFLTVILFFSSRIILSIDKCYSIDPDLVGAAVDSKVIASALL